MKRSCKLLGVLVCAASASAFSVAPRAPAGAVASRRAGAAMSIGYQTEAAGSQALLREMGLRDDLMLLRVAAARAADEKDPVALNTLMNKCELLKVSIKKQINELKEQQGDLTTLLRHITTVAESGKRVRGSEFDSYLAALRRELQ